MDLKQLTEKYTEDLLRYRRELHRIPELSNEEEETAAYIAAALREMGLEPVTGLGGFGVSALIRGGKPGKCICLRADMDALAVGEATGLPFASEHPGKAHACGHDTHMAMVLAAGALLSEIRGELSGSVRLLFQPAEEAAETCGAPRIIASGILNDPPVDLMLGQHVWPEYPVGTVALRPGPMMAACDRFMITVHGRGCHGAAPQNGVDAIYIACQLVVAIQSIISRNLGPLEGGVITVGSIRGGDSYNLVTENATLEGTVRTLDPKVRETVIRRLQEMVPTLAESFGGSAELEYFYGCDAVLNGEKEFRFLADTVQDVLGPEALTVPETPTMIAEDYAFYGSAVPAAFYWLGCRKEDAPEIPLHSPSFVPEEEALPLGLRLLAEAAVRFLR